MDALPDGWEARAASETVLPDLARFVDALRAEGGRKHPATVDGVRGVLDGAVAGQARILRDAAGAIRGYSVLFPPAEGRNLANGSLVTDEGVPADVVDAVVGLLQDGARKLPGLSGPAELRIFSADGRTFLKEALLRRGFAKERSFFGMRRPVAAADAVAPSLPGFTVLDWDAVRERDLLEQVRQAQHETFLEHFGELSKDPETWRRYLQGHEFEPKYSFAVLDDGAAEPTVAGYVLGSNYTDDTLGFRDVNAHTSYIGVRRQWRRKGLAALLLGTLWARVHELGVDAVSLGVDQQNGSNAGRLYASLGYEAISSAAAYRYTEPEGN
ncbi:GNAT family N-acetyltransferase [Arthrobacter ginkgonis]|uniref:GNAT family N-acetyltransferase n=1 Tax=Arthrobacter ginkgonis TaxID=1630594 RepID=UPI0031F19FD1